MRTFFWTCTLIFLLSAFVSAQDLAQLKKTIEDNLPAELPRNPESSPPSPELAAAYKTIADAANKIYALPNLSEQDRQWTLQRESIAILHLAHTDTAAYFPRLTVLSDELDRIGNNNLAQLAEKHVLLIGTALAVANKADGGTGINMQSLAERMVLYAERYSDSTLIENLLLKVRGTNMTMSARDRRLAVIAPVFQEYFKKYNQTAKANALEPDIQRSTLPGKPMRLAGVDLDGNDFDPATLKGKVVLVQFWGTWCGPCRAEMPDLIALYEKYHASGFEIIGINTGVQGDDERKVKQFVGTQLFGGKIIPWKILHEGLSERKKMQTVTKFYGIEDLPVLILIGRDGKVLQVHPLVSTLGDLVEKATSPFAAILEGMTEEDKKMFEEIKKQKQAELDEQIRQELSQ